MVSDPVTVLVTGFGPFPGCPINPTGALARWIDNGIARAPQEVRLIATTVETSWVAVRTFADGPLNDVFPDVALHFGVSVRARGFQIETVARNTASNGADCTGATYSGTCLVPGAPSSLRTSLNARQLVTALRQRGLCADTSHDAGTYLCNMLLFLSLQGMTNARSPLLRGFVHVPPFRPGRFGPRELRKGVEILVERCAGQYRRTARVVKRR